MIWLYRLQQRLSITRHEGLAILTLSVLFLFGVAVREIQQQQLPPVAVDSLVAQPITDTAAAPTNVPAGPSPDTPINVNAASKDALMALPGIGPALAERIIRYRSTQRPFQRVAELRRVSGIGSETLASLRPLVQIGGDESD
jgi:competence protein ComEA